MNHVYTLIPPSQQIGKIWKNSNFTSLELARGVPILPLISNLRIRLEYPTTLTLTLILNSNPNPYPNSY